MHLPDLRVLFDYRIRNLCFSLLDSATRAKCVPPFIGLDSCLEILNSQLAIENYDFQRLLAFNVTWTVSNVFFHVPLEIAFALALEAKDLIGRPVYRSLFELPRGVPGYVAALTWRSVYGYR